VDSNEMSFKMAGIMAFRNVTPNARPVLLEPLMDVEVWAPEDVLGDVMGDLSSRRGQILGTEQDGRLTKVKAIVPEAELYKYSTTLHSITHRQKFHGHAEAPPEVSAKVAAENSKEKELQTA
jgi:elongation factor G